MRSFSRRFCPVSGAEDLSRWSLNALGRSHRGGKTKINSSGTDDAQFAGHMADCKRVRGRREKKFRFRFMSREISKGGPVSRRCIVSRTVVQCPQFFGSRNNVCLFRTEHVTQTNNQYATYGDTDLDRSGTQLTSFITSTRYLTKKKKRPFQN